MRDLRWKLLHSEYLFRETWFTLRKDTCEKPDGSIVSPYYVSEFPTWVTVVAFTEENKMVMVRQYRHAIGETCIELAGGCVDDTDKDLQFAAARELLEETGYHFSEYTYLGKTSPNPSTNGNWMHMFLATGGKKVAEQNLDANEEIDVLIYSVDEVKQLLKDQKIIQAMHVTCLFYAFEKMGIRLIG